MVKVIVRNGKAVIIRKNDNKVVAVIETNGIAEFELSDIVKINDKEEKAIYDIDKDKTTAQVEFKE